MEVDGHEPSVAREEGEQQMEYAADGAAQYAAGSVTMEQGAQHGREAVQEVAGGEGHEGAADHTGSLCLLETPQIAAPQIAAPLAEVDMEGKKIAPGNELLELEREEDGVVEVVAQHEAEPVAAVQAPPPACTAPSAADAMPETVPVSDAGAAPAVPPEIVPDGTVVQETAPAPALEDDTVPPSLAQALSQEAAPAVAVSSEKASGLSSRPVSAAAVVVRGDGTPVWPPAVTAVAGVSPAADTPTLKQYLTALFPANQTPDQQAYVALSAPLGQPAAAGSAVGYAAAAMPPLATWQGESGGLKKDPAYASPSAGTAVSAAPAASVAATTATPTSATSLKKRAGRQEVIEATKICAPVQPKDIRTLDRRLPHCEPGSLEQLMSRTNFTQHINHSIGSELSGTAYERLFLIYSLLHTPDTGVEKIEVDNDDPSNNCPLGFCKLTVLQPQFHKAVLDMVNTHRAWSKRLGKSPAEKRAKTTPVYEVLRQMGIAPVPRSRGPTETDPGPRDFLYSTKYVYHKDKYFRTVYRTLKNGIYIGREETMKMHFQYAEDEARQGGGGGGAGAAGGASAAGAKALGAAGGIAGGGNPVPPPPPDDMEVEGGLGLDGAMGAGKGKGLKDKKARDKKERTKREKTPAARADPKVCQIKKKKTGPGTPPPPPPPEEPKFGADARAAVGVVSMSEEEACRKMDEGNKAQGSMMMSLGDGSRIDGKDLAEDPSLNSLAPPASPVVKLTKDTAPSAQLEGGDVDVRPAAVAADIADATIGGEVPGSGEEDAAGGDKGKAKQPLRKRKLPEAIPGPVVGGKRGEGEGQLESRQTQAVQALLHLSENTTQKGETAAPLAANASANKKPKPNPAGGGAENSSEAGGKAESENVLETEPFESAAVGDKGLAGGDAASPPGKALRSPKGDASGAAVDEGNAARVTRRSTKDV